MGIIKIYYIKLKFNNLCHKVAKILFVKLIFGSPRYRDF